MYSHSLSYTTYHSLIIFVIPDMPFVPFPIFFLPTNHLSFLYVYLPASPNNIRREAPPSSWADT